MSVEKQQGITLHNHFKNRFIPNRNPFHFSRFLFLIETEADEIAGVYVEVLQYSLICFSPSSLYLGPRQIFNSTMYSFPQ